MKKLTKIIVLAVSLFTASFVPQAYSWFIVDDVLGLAGGIVGGTLATAGAIATAPFGGWGYGGYYPGYYNYGYYPSYYGYYDYGCPGCYYY